MTDDGIQMIVNDNVTTTGDYLIEVMAFEVWLLTCGCIEAASAPEQPPTTEPSLTAPVRALPSTPVRVVATIHTGSITDAGVAKWHRHGGRHIRLPLKDWYRQMTQSGHPNLGGYR